MEPSRWSRWVTIVAVLMLAGIAAVVSYSHMYELALRYGEPEWRAALFPLSVDGMIVASSMTLLGDARRGRKGGLLPWTLLIIGSAASLAANVAVADPTVWSRVIHAWPSVALIGAYELLMREFRNTARSVRTTSADDEHDPTWMKENQDTKAQDAFGSKEQGFSGLRAVQDTDRTQRAQREDLTPFQGRAWQRALDQERETGELPTGARIAERFERKERWGRLVKERGLQQRRRTPDQAVSVPAKGPWQLPTEKASDYELVRDNG